jgi:type 1 glutamine amidotransferase
MRARWTTLVILGLLSMASLAPGQNAPKPARKPPTPEELARRAEDLQKRVAAEMPKVEAAMPGKPIVAPKKPRKLLVFTLSKGFWHDSIPLAAQTFSLMGKKTGAFEATVSDDPQMFAPGKLQQFDAVMMDNSCGVPLAEESLRKSLAEFVKSGKGIAGIHGAADAFYNTWPEFGEMIGGYFAGHPFGQITVKLDDPQSPINAMFQGRGFDFQDEIYTFKAPYSREKLHVLLSIDWDKSKKAQEAEAKAVANNRWKAREDHDYALSWIRQFGEGRVFYCAFGHRHEIFWDPVILQHFLAGIQYALGDLPADATPTAKAAPAACSACPAAAACASADGPQGWRTLFNGKDLSGWQNRDGKAPGAGWTVQDGTLRREKGAGDLWTKDRFGDFVLDLEFKTEGNSGIFIRTDNPKDNVQTGIEIQVDRPAKTPGKHSVGAVYDCLAPSKEATKAGEWNHAVVTAQGNRITVVMNDQPIIDMDLDRWTEANKNPDGSPNKFRTALKNFKREGHVGLQDHGAVVSYRNLRVKTLNQAKP